MKKREYIDWVSETIIGHEYGDVGESDIPHDYEERVRKFAEQVAEGVNAFQLRSKSELQISREVAEEIEHKRPDVYEQPVEEGGEYRVQVEKEGDEGDGIAYIDGFVVFVQDADVGDVETVEVYNVDENCAFAKVA